MIICAGSAGSSRQVKRFDGSSDDADGGQMGWGGDDDGGDDEGDEYAEAGGSHAPQQNTQWHARPGKDARGGKGSYDEEDVEDDTPNNFY